MELHNKYPEDYANGVRRAHTTAIGQADEKCGVMKVLEIILQSSLPPVIKETLSSGDVARTEFQSDLLCLQCGD